MTNLHALLWIRHLGRLFLTGLVALLPIGVTLAIFYWLGASAEALLGGLMPDAYYYPGMGLLLGVILVILVGLSIQYWAIREFLIWGENLMARLPIVKIVYGSVRDFMDFFTALRTREDFNQVVSITLGDMRIIGFVTRPDLIGMPAALGGADQIVVYIPLSYQIGGLTVILPRSAVEPLNISLQDAMRFVVTAGVSKPAATASDKPLPK
jgi:uncharacterized membrane protein